MGYTALHKLALCAALLHTVTSWSLGGRSNCRSLNLQSQLSSDTSPWQPVRSHKWALTAKRRVRKADSEASPDAPNQRPLAESNDAVDAAAQLLVESADSLPSFFEAPPANPGTSASSPVEEVDANTQGMVAQMEANEGAVSDPFEQSMLDDIAEFKRTRNVDPVEDDKNAQLKKVVTVLGTVLSYNFVIIIGFFLWFLTGCIGKFAFESDVVINAFTGLWEVLILPLLSTHMALTFLSAGIEKFGLPENKAA